MADQLMTPEDLASLLERDDLDTYKATMLSEAATAVVQATVGGQRIVYVADDTLDMLGTTDSWLQLPQWPVARDEVSAVTIDGEAVTDFKQFGARLWRACGWQPRCGVPAAIGGVYSHGYPDGRQELQMGRSAVLTLCATAYPNPTSASSEHIDDYGIVYNQLAKVMEASSFLKAALRSQYGSRASLTRIG
jgi:hypothetical protein